MTKCWHIRIVDESFYKKPQLAFVLALAPSGQATTQTLFPERSASIHQEGA
jgi:hypothetical protein